MSEPPTKMIIGQTTTSIARLAASREVVDDAPPRSFREVNMGGGYSLENIQGPIPELSEDTPDWMEVYGQVAAASNALAAKGGSRRPRPALGNTIPSSSSRGGQFKHSPYTQKMLIPDSSQRKSQQPAFPAVSFNKVYGRTTDEEDPNQDYIGALKSLTDSGSPVKKRSGDPHQLSETNERDLNFHSGENGLKLTSKFRTKGSKTNSRKPVGSDQKFVSGGQGFMLQATSESVLSSIRRMNQARARQAALDAAQRLANRPVLEKEVKEKKEKPPTVRTSVQFEDGSKYRGDWSTRGLGSHGQGLLNFITGDKYVGGFKRHMFDGFGTYYYANGDKYEGHWKKGEKHGEEGTFSSADGTTLTVSWKNDRANGHGLCTYKNGATFEGEYLDDVKEGQGCYKTPEGDEYRGEFHNDKIYGRGLFIDKKNGTSYEGTFHHSKRHVMGDDDAEFTMHHGLFGDFTFHGGVPDKDSAKKTPKKKTSSKKP
mmetsp:Transcript_53465/g.68608  ORF Transcript_53465/g.68608 Transcript_53465/m.68608 type:complete len:484 (+) Transcript_53465:94-1545(+)